jgi:VWFA-related protein
MPQPKLEAEVIVTITQPAPGQPIFGRVVVEAEATFDAGPLEAELLVDGKPVGRVTGPPFRWTVEVGDENVEHRLEVVAKDDVGTTGRALLVTPRVHVDESLEVELQQLYVTVEGGGGRVLDLEAGEFEIRDDGRPQGLVTFARGDLPLTAVLLIDSSESMKGELFAASLRGAETFAAGMRELDEAMVMLFSDQLLAATPFTDDPAALLDALRGVEAGGNTALNDHLYLALNLLDGRQGRRVVVLFTDGADLNSVLDMEEVLWKARHSQALVYWIQLDEGRAHKGFATAWRDADRNREERRRLETAVEQSGGRIATIHRVDEVEPAFRGILVELREQYALGYYPSESRADGSWREVDVRVARSGLRVRTRGGYVDF